MKKITVYCELNLKNYTMLPVSYELISKAVELSRQAFELKKEQYSIEAVALGSNLDEDSLKKALNAGANRVVLVKNKTLSAFSQTIFAQSFIEYYLKNKSEVILFPATPYGRILAPRITTILNTGLVADCTGLDFILKNDELKLAPTRPTFGSELMATILSKKFPQCATVRPNTFVANFGLNADGQYCEFEPCEYSETRIKLLRTMLEKNTTDVNFDNAKVVLAAGFGLSEGKDKKYYLRLEELAKKINAKLACTRKVADFDLLPREFQIGQTGSNVVADVYIAFGISGAIQHVSGMKNSKTIIAINTDENADIFKYSDYKIIADAKKIIDEMLEILS